MYKFMKWFTIWLFVWMVFFSLVEKAKAGTLNYKTYYAGSYAPNLEFPFYDSVSGYNTDGSNSNPYGLGTTVLSSGTISTPSGYYWGSGQVLDSGRSDYVAVEITGYITWPGTTGQQQTVYFGVAADDGVFMNIDGTNVITDWEQQGTATWNATGSLTKTAGTQYPITIWMYEYGGGAALDVNYCLTNSYSTTCQTDMPTSWFSTTQVAPSAGISSSQQTEVNTAKNKTQNGNAIYISQSGSGIDLDIVQDGDNNLIIGSDLTNAGSIQGDNNEITLTQKNNNNVLGIDVNGNSNNVDIWQDTDQRAIVNITGASNTLDLEQLTLSNAGDHYAKVTVNGNSNSLIIDQKETGDKILFLDVDSSNNVQVDQKGTGDHYLNIILTDSHTLDITQDGSGSHNAHIDLSGNNTSITLTQDSSTDQNYYLEQNCVSTSCSAIVTQN
jgi:hypothetical protein